jgi:hypothetical protein
MASCFKATYSMKELMNEQMYVRIYTYIYFILLKICK